MHRMEFMFNYAKVKYILFQRRMLGEESDVLSNIIIKVQATACCFPLMPVTPLQLLRRESCLTETPLSCLLRIANTLAINLARVSGA